MPKEFNIMNFFLCLITISFILGNAAVNIVTALIIVYHLFQYKKFNKIDIFVAIIIFFFSLIFIHSLFFDNNEKYEILKTLKFLCIFIIIYSSTKIKKETLNNYIFFLLIFILFIAFDVIYQNFIGYDIFGLKVPEIHKPRLTGPFFTGEPIPGSFMAYLSPLVIFYLYEKKQLYRLNLFILIVFYSILLTGERMALLLFILISLVAYFFIIKNNKNYLILLIVVILGVTLKLMLFSDSYGVQRIISIKNFMKPEYFLNSHYFSHYLTSIKIFLDNIFLGSGFDNFKYLCQLDSYDNIYNSSEIRCSTHQHNFYLQIIESFGILVFLIFILLLFYPIFGFFNKIKNSEISFLKYFILYVILVLPFKTSGDIFATWYGGLFWFLFAVSARGMKNSLSKNQ